MSSQSPQTDCSTLAADLGVTHVVHAPDVAHFPWQVMLAGGRCVLVSADFHRHAVIRSDYYPEEEAKNTVATADTPYEVLAAVRRALAETDLEHAAGGPDDDDAGR